MTVTVFKTYFKKKETIKINYRSYFKENKFRNNLLINLLPTRKRYSVMNSNTFL